MRHLLLAATSLSLVGSIACNAQTINEDRRPVTPSTDSNGIDILTGGVTVSEPVIEIPGAGNLQLDVTYNGSWARSGSIFTLIEAHVDMSGQSGYEGNYQPEWPRIYTVTTGSGTFQYQCLSPDVSSCQQVGPIDGSKLEFVNGEYGGVVHIDRAGKKTVFPALTGGDGPTSPDRGSAVASEIIYPNGERITLSQTLADGVTTVASSNTGYSVSHSNSQRSYYKNGALLTSVSGGLVGDGLGGSTRTYTDQVGRQFRAHVEPRAGVCLSALAWAEIGGVRTEYTYHAQSGEYGGGTVNALSRSGRVWSYSNGYGGRSVTAPDGSVRSITSEPISSGQTCFGGRAQAGRILSESSPSQKVTSFGYGALNDPALAQQLTSATLPEGDKLLYGYDDRGNLTRTTQIGKAGVASRLIFEAAYAANCENNVTCNLPMWTKSEAGAKTNYSYDPTHGGVLEILEPVDTNGLRRRTWNEYSSFDTGSGIIWRLAAEHVCSIQSSGANNDCGTETELVTRYTYWEKTFLPLTVTRTNGAGDVSAVTTFSYDPAGRPLSITDPTGVVQYLRYDAVGRQTWAVTANSAGTFIAKHITYDTSDRVTRTDVGTIPTASSDAISIAHSEVNNFDAVGNLVETRVLDGAATVLTRVQTSYDLLDRPDCTARRMNPATFTAALNACDLGQEGAFGPDRITKRGYDGDGRLSKVVEGLGAINGGLGIATQESGYTDNGKVAWVRDANGNQTYYGFDDFDRLHLTSFPDGSHEVVDYDAAGHLWKLTKRDGKFVTFGYEATGRQTSTTYSDGQLPVARSYDSIGRLAQVTQGANSVGFEYGSLGFAKSTTSNGRKLSYDYDLAGRRTKLSYPDGFQVEYKRDVAGFLSSVDEGGFGPLVSYTYDSLGRRLKASQPNGSSSEYSYNGVGVISSVSQKFADATADLSTTISYNPAMQIVAQQRNNGKYAWGGYYNVNRSYTANNLNQYTSVGGEPLEYDGRGNLTKSSGSTYAYDVENRLVSAPNTTLEYDPVGRLSRIGGGAATRFLYDGDSLVAEYDDGGTLIRRYVHGEGVDEPLVWYEAGDNNLRRWLHRDVRGSIIAQSYQSGSLGAVNSYDEFGIPSADNVGRFQYTGQLWLPEIGMHYYKARIYSPTLGRFMQTDPIGYGDGLNLYAYVGNDPINAVDPSGLEAGSSGCKREKAAAQQSLDDILVCGDPLKVPGVPGGMSLSDGGMPYGPIPQSAQPAPGRGRGVVAGGGRRPGRQPQRKPHHYTVTRDVRCSATNAFNKLKAPGMSAPGSPAAQEGFTPRVILEGNNPIAQSVDSQNLTITNSTLPGHTFYPGTVVMQVSPLSSNWSRITIVGEGDGYNPGINNFVGIAFFGSVANHVQELCSPVSSSLR